MTRRDLGPFAPPLASSPTRGAASRAADCTRPMPTTLLSCPAVDLLGPTCGVACLPHRRRPKYDASSGRTSALRFACPLAWGGRHRGRCHSSSSIPPVPPNVGGRAGADECAQGGGR